MTKYITFQHNFLFFFILLGLKVKCSQETVTVEKIAFRRPKYPFTSVLGSDNNITTQNNIKVSRKIYY